jgi:hypothetical protein
MKEEASSRAARVIERTARRISAELDRMVADLPEDASPQMAIGQVVSFLADMQPWFTDLVMEDPDVRETYADAVSCRTARPQHAPEVFNAKWRRK